MKIDLTTLPRTEQIGHVVAYLAKRAAARQHGTGDKEIFSSDLLEKFKHRGPRTHNQRIAYFTALMREACAFVAAAARTQPTVPVKILVAE
jgi:hypothetical protein